MKGNKFKFLAIIMVLIMVSGLFGACQGITPQKETSEKNSIVFATSQEPLRFFSCGPKGSNNNDLIVLNNIYDPLIKMNADGTLSPVLAKSWDISDDGLCYTFYLRDDVYFHNGDKMTAEDVAYTFTICYPSSTGGALLINFDHAEVVDDTTVKIYLSDPFAAFLNGVASRAAFIISKEYMEEKGVDVYLEEPIGTGPYKFISRVSGDTITLQANEEYWGVAPAIETINIKLISDTTTQIISLESNDIDGIFLPSVSLLKKLAQDSQASWDYCSSAARVTIIMGCNEGYPSYNVDFRRAVQHAINKQEIIDGILEGYGVIGDIDMVPNYTGRPDDYMVVEQDIEKAKEYLAKSGYNNEPYELLVQAGSDQEAAAVIIQAQLLKIGINCQITATDTATFTELWQNAAYGGVIRRTSSSLLDADALSSYFWDGRVNYMKNLFPRFDEIKRLVEKGRSEQNVEARKKIYGEACDIITDEALLITLYYDISTIAYNKDLKGVQAHPLNYVSFSDWSY